MIVEIGRHLQELSFDLTEYQRVLDIPSSTYRFWASEADQGRLVDLPPKPPTSEELALYDHIREEMRKLAHRRHVTFGLRPLEIRFKGQIPRKKFRELAAEVRAEVLREMRAGTQRYEFLFPDVAHSLDFSALPADFQTGARRYAIRIVDDCTRCTIRKAITFKKGASVGAAFLGDHLREGFAPLLFKYDREFDTPEFENQLLSRKIVPLPNPPASPQTNGKHERTNRDVKDRLRAVGGQLQLFTTEELRHEVDFCFHQLDELEERAFFNGRTRRQEYDARDRAPVDRDTFFNEAVALRRQLLCSSGNRISPTSAWFVVGKDVLSKYGLVRYWRPSEV